MSNENDFIFHIIQEQEWQLIKSKREYEPISLQNEGFIHFSYQKQLKSVAKRFYSGVPNLLVLKISVKKLSLPVKVEKVGDEGEFPHLYGKLNLDSIIDVFTLETFLNQ